MRRLERSNKKPSAALLAIPRKRRRSTCLLSFSTTFSVDIGLPPDNFCLSLSQFHLPLMEQHTPDSKPERQHEQSIAMPAMQAGTIRSQSLEVLQKGDSVIE
ncbi:hypothetical protein [Thermobaculum terrenum]|uniref:hypothetical protein n=1 Tax=Thermobaculum terrenum TaxID=166501 RepID=UPI00019BECF2|nr:hypothetical protein [Thermobaculum terrenum]